MIVVMNTVAYGVEAVVVADMKSISKIYYICNAFTCDAVYGFSREAD